MKVYEILVEPRTWSYVHKVLEQHGLKLRDLSPGLQDTEEFKQGVRTFICQQHK